MDIEWSFQVIWSHIEPADWSTDWPMDLEMTIRHINDVNLHGTAK